MYFNIGFEYMRYRHFSGDWEGSKFGELAGNVQNAIEVQANIDLEANKLSKYYGKAIKGEEIETSLFNTFCEKYAQGDETKLKELVILESKALYMYPLTEERFAFYEKRAKIQAERMDNEVKRQVVSHYKQFSR